MKYLSVNEYDLKSINSFKINQGNYIDYKNIVCLKPWGYEFLIYMSQRIGMWFLNIKLNHGTSLHTHFKKNTFLIVISGTIKLTLINEYILLKDLNCVFIPKKKFHGIHSLSENSYILEIELFDEDVTYSDKNDLLRIKDNYKRDKTGYEKSVENIKENIEKFNYFYLDTYLKKEINNTIINYNTLKNLDINKDAVYILMNGPIILNNKILQSGSYFSYEDLNLLDKSQDIEFLQIKNMFKTDNKIITSLEELKLLANNNWINKKVILTSGCFDILHIGHIKLLEKAKQCGDILVVCLSSDEQIKHLKGDQRPINNFNDRLNLFKNLIHVDYIYPYFEDLSNNNETILDEIMLIVKPFSWVKGGDYNKDVIKKLHPCLKNIQIFDLVEGVSTTNIISKINDQYLKKYKYEYRND